MTSLTFLHCLFLYFYNKTEINKNKVDSKLFITHNTIKMQPIIKFIASAGSGKTFTLTEKYILLLFENEQNFRHILAVTFTNKASNEMKIRIIKEINKLANSDNSPYYEKIKLTHNIDKTEITKRAKKIRHLILHNYSAFHIETIDSFFQRIVKNFAKELGLPWNFSLELNSEKILEEVVDLLLLELNQNTALKKAILNFTLEKIQDGKTKNIKKDIVKLSKQIFTEEYNMLSAKTKKELHDIEQLQKKFETILSIKTAFENKIETLAKQALELLKKHDLQITDFSYGKSGFINQFNKFLQDKDYSLGKRFVEAGDNIDTWNKGKKIDERIQAIYNDGLNDIVNKCIAICTQEITDYNTAHVIGKVRHTLPIIGDVSKRTSEYLIENNLFILSNTNSLINELIDNNDAPFIYEKTGTQIKHYMIDEFQDTSKLQWYNFKPLLTESSSYGNENYIVGDIKQSIYRWRNGDWKLLAYEIEQHFKNMVETQILTFNWRSWSNIINFNNTIFNTAPQILKTEYENQLTEYAEKKKMLALNYIETAYANQAQKKPTNCTQGGYIKIEFNPAEKATSEECDLFFLEKTASAVEKLQQQGYKASDIAILTRERKQIKKIIDFFNEYKQSNNAKQGVNYEIISNEDLSINKSPAVRILLASFEFIKSQKNIISKLIIANEYNLLKKGTRSLDISIYTESVLQSLLKNHRNKSLYEICEYVIASFELNYFESELPFIHAFLDIIIDFSKNKSASIYNFLYWWKQNQSSKSVCISENQEAIKLMTIHKSKGLEFPCVIIPFLQSALHDSQKPQTIWAHCPVPKFNIFSSLPIELNKHAKESHYADLYYAEMQQSYIDNLNLLYVAFTRAEQCLFVFTDNQKEGKISSISNVLYHTICNGNKYPNNSNETLLDTHSFFNKNNWEFEYGNIPIKKNAETQKNTENKITHRSSSLIGRIVFSTHGRSFFEDFSNTSKRISYGSIMHEIMEHLITVKDIEGSVARAYYEGKISQSDRESLSALLHKKLKSQPVAGWFAEDNTIKNEITILSEEGKTLRPDRVIINKNTATIIDYKFGEPETQHITQMKSYKNIIQKMGYHTTGFIWYFSHDKIKEI